MTKLATIHRELARLLKRRRIARWATAHSALVVAVLGALVAIFTIDWALEMTKAQRVVAMAFGLLAVAWAARRYTWPWLGQRETELDMALLVERQQKIDSDLVAALQFESAEAARWGSPQLESAVIDYVADFGRGWNVLEGFDRRQVVRRLSTALAAVAIVAVAAVLFPDYVRTFLNRLALGSRHYPTATSIERVLINGQAIDFEELSPGQVVVRSPYGQTLRFAVHAADEVPESGRVDLVSVASGSRRSIDLSRSSPADDAAVFHGELAQLVDSVSFQVYLGDAWTDPAHVTVIPLPLVEVTLIPTPPAYAQAPAARSDPPVNSRQLSVLEGSSVSLGLKSINKRLSKAVLTIGGTRFPLRQQDDAGQVWTLASKTTPLANITEQLRYEIQVEDEDALELEHPIQGFIRIKTDRKPSVSASLVSHHVVPTATPTIKYRATDDFGISKLVLHLEIIRQGAEGEPSQATTAKPIVVTDPANPAGQDRAQKREGKFRLDLAEYKLQKNDQVRATLEAIDYRGQREGKSESSEPLLLEVTDRSGFLAAQYEQDEKSYRQTGAIIKRQTETGGKR